VSLNTILNEEVMALYSITHVVFDSKVVNSMNSDDSCIGLMNCITPRERIGNCSCHVVMNAITPWYLWLPAKCELSVGNLTLKTL
jgi:hypothetical protein